jgi:hypothetical protein
MTNQASVYGLIQMPRSRYWLARRVDIYFTLLSLANFLKRMSKKLVFDLHIILPCVWACRFAFICWKNSQRDLLKSGSKDAILNHWSINTMNACIAHTKYFICAYLVNVYWTKKRRRVKLPVLFPWETNLLLKLLENVNVNKSCRAKKTALCHFSPVPCHFSPVPCHFFTSVNGALVVFISMYLTINPLRCNQLYYLLIYFAAVGVKRLILLLL